MVSYHCIGTYWISLFLFPDDYIHPVDIETEDIVSGREEGEEVIYALVVFTDTLGVEFMDDNEEFKTFIKSYFDDMNNHIMWWFQFMAIQLGGKLAAGGSSSSHHEVKKTYRETIFSRTRPHNRPHDFKN